MTTDHAQWLRSGTSKLSVRHQLFKDCTSNMLGRSTISMLPLTCYCQMLYSGDPTKDAQQDGHASSWRLDKNSCDRLIGAHLTSEQNFHNKILTKNYFSDQQCSAQGQVLHCKIRHQGCNSAQRQVFHCKFGNLGCFPHLNKP